MTMTSPYLSAESGNAGPLDLLGPASNTLPFRVAPHRDEPSFATVGRLALASGHRTVRGLLGEYAPGVDFKAVRSGLSQDSIARLMGIRSEIFKGATPVFDDAGNCRIGETSFRRRGLLSLDRVSVCPKCLAEDAAFTATQANIIVEPHVRTHWFFEPVKACAIHRVMLRRIRCNINEPASWAYGGATALDFAGNLEPAPDDEVLAAQFVAGRLAFGEPISETLEILALPLDRAIKAYTAIGILLSENRPLDAHAALKVGLTLAAAEACPATIESIFDQIGSRSIAAGLVLPRERLYAGLVKIASEAVHTPQFRLFAEALVRSGAKYAADGGRPLARGWSMSEPGNEAVLDLVGYDYDQISAKIIGHAHLAQEFGRNAALARLALPYLECEHALRGFGGKGGRRHGGTPVVSSETLDNFRTRFVAFSELVKRCESDLAELYQVLLDARVKRIDDASSAQGARLGRFHTFFDRRSAEAALGLA